MALLLCAVLLLAPQDPPADAVVVSGVMPDGRVALAGLGLGDGGVDPLRSGAGEAARGVRRSTGGVLVRARREGVKFDFPSGAEVLVGPDGRVHLRDGGRTLPTTGVLEIVLADRTRVEIQPNTSPLLAPLQVLVEDERGQRLLWRDGMALDLPVQEPRRARQTLIALGDGTTLYDATLFGPVVVLRAVLFPKAAEGRLPRERVVVLGDILARSLQRLPEHAPPRSVQFPQAAEAAQNLARIAPRLFAAGVIPRPRGARGSLVFPLVDEFQLVVATTEAGPVTVGLHRGTSTVPIVEWLAARRTTLHFVRPDGGANGPRYFLAGLDVQDLCTPALPASTRRDDLLARRTIRRLGGVPLPVAVGRVEDASAPATGTARDR